MTFKREPRYIAAGTAAYLEFQLDPDIYKTDVATALGVVVTKPAGASLEFIPYTVKLAKRSSSVTMIRMKIERVINGETESRRIELVCDRQNADTAKNALNGKTVNIGPANASWTLKV
ncbi:MAG: hypothetical protein NW214_08640 [Pseudanabaenaceae cyanobacterium bins.39]|nr:hypothetical protein [Pseudanabaenaceae cyanobacterium bins.39]